MVDIKIQNWIKLSEGLSLETYIDTTGNLTVGYGRNLQKGIRYDEAELMFQNDLKDTVDSLEKYGWYLTQPENVQNALINMCFNLGITKLLKFEKMIAAIKEKNYTVAAREALDSQWAKQVGKRATSVALMLRGEDAET